MPEYSIGPYSRQSVDTRGVDPTDIPTDDAYHPLAPPSDLQLSPPSHAISSEDTKRVLDCQPTGPKKMIFGLIIDKIWWTGLTPWEFEFVFQVALYLPP